MRRSQRRRFLVLAGTALAAPLQLLAQTTGRVRRIGYLSLQLPDEAADKSFKESLRAAGYETAKDDVVVEWRWGNRNRDNLPALAADLVNRNVELIVAFSNEETAAAVRATRAVPIVMLWVIAPVENGYIDSLSHPGGNVTGTTYFDPEMLTRTFQLLREVVPAARRLAVLWSPHPDMRGYDLGMTKVDRLAAQLGVKMDYFGVTRTEQLPSALERIAATRPDGLIYLQDDVFYGRAREISAMALERKIPSIGTVPFWVDVQGLLTYCPDVYEIMRRNADYVVRILRGAKPSDLPVEQPTRYGLGVNLKTARAIGATIPHSVLAQADRVVE